MGHGVVPVSFFFSDDKEVFLWWGTRLSRGKCREHGEDDQGVMSNLHIGVVGGPECSAFGLNEPRLKPCCSQQLSFPAASLWDRPSARRRSPTPQLCRSLFPIGMFSLRPQ